MSFAKCFNLLKLKYCTEYKFSCNSATCFTRHGSCTLQHFVRHYTRNASSPLYITVGDFFGQQFPLVRENLIGWRLKVAGMLQIVDIGDIFGGAKLHEKFKKLRTAV